MSAKIFCLFACLSLGASTLAVPPTPVGDPSGINKGRYISMSVPSNGGEPTALRVTLVSLHHVVPPYTGGPSIPFTEFEGEIRWVGPPIFATESDNDPTPFIAAPLQCAPYYHDWSTLGLFHVYGDAIVPNSSYDVAALDESCAAVEEDCADLSSSLSIATARYGDVITPFNPPSPTTQPDFEDHAAVIYKVMRRPGGESKAIMQLHPSVPDPTRTVNLWDVLLQGNAIPGTPYPYSPTSCISPQSGEPKSDGNVSFALGDPLLKVFITPVPAQGTSSYPAGTQITGQELIASNGGFRAFFNVQVQDYNPDAIEGLIRGYQIQIDAEGLGGVNANPPAPDVNLLVPQEPCPNGAVGTTHCRTIFGEGGARCIDNQCLAAFVSSNLSEGGFPGHPDALMVGGFRFGSDMSPTGLIVAGGSLRPFESETVPDDGQRKYLGTFVLDIPTEAVGHTYTLSLRHGGETMVITGPVALSELPIAQVTPAVLKIGMDSVGIDANRCRFLSIVPGHSGEQMAIRVKLVSLHHVNPPYSGGPSVPFTSFEGEYRWVGPPTQYEESTSNNVPFFASALQCEPHYQDWSSAGYLHVTGSAIVPSSEYEVQFVPVSCMGNENSCPDISAPILKETTRWGDVEESFNPPSPTVQPDVTDIGALVNKFRSASGAPIKARGLLAGEAGNAHGEITPAVLSPDFGFSHISACVDAFRGVPYPYSGPEACP